MPDPGVTQPSDTSHVSDAAIDRLFAQAGAERWGLARDSFAAAIRRIAAKLAERGSAATTVREHSWDAVVDGLHAEDLALACACAEGLDAAWEHFVRTYRPELYRAARAMSDDATGRELADSLYADLFGMHERDGGRLSLFRYYHGRAKLGTWLRSVLAQRHVDLLRSRRHTTSLDDADDGDPGRQLAAPPADDPARAHSMRAAAAAVTAALATLLPEDRTRLAYYYAHGLTLAEAGRLFGESEATASRKLDRARRTLRAAITAHLADSGLDVADVDDWAAVAREAWDTTLVEALGVARPQDVAPPTFKA